MMRIFLHGLDSSGFGTKGRFFAQRFPDMLRPDFDGSLEQRLERLRVIVSGYEEMVIVGSSFGGLMGTCLAIEQPERIKRLILLAPALNFSEYQPPARKLPMETLLVIGQRDTVTPPAIVIPAAKASFARLTVEVADDDHLLHATFEKLDWARLLA